MGYEKVPPRSPYPPRRHPVDHHFDWENGRVLSAYQLVYVIAGRGVFESDMSDKRYRIEAGDVIALFPGVWHRYAPEFEIGWVEQWIEFSGPAVDRIKNAGLFIAERPIWHVGFPQELLQAFERCHALAQQRSIGVQSLLSTMGLHMLAVLLRAGREHPGAPRFFEQKIQEAQRILAIRYHEELSMEQLARELSVSYSSFRQAFKAQTGISPKQYQIQIRLNKARDFLASTTKSIGEISEILGFDSGFHFSKQFKDATGLSPLTWRKRLGGLRAKSRAKTQRIN